MSIDKFDRFFFYVEVGTYNLKINVNKCFAQKKNCNRNLRN